MNHQDTKAKDFQIKFNLPVKQAFEYKYSMQNNKIHLTVPVKREEEATPVEERHVNVDLTIEVSNHETGFSMDNLSINMESFTNAIKKLQGRN